LISRLTLLAIAVFAHVDAAGAANVAEGEKLARKVCVTCHIVAPGVGPAQVTAGIPSFMSIADKPDQTATQIQAKILNPHLICSRKTPSFLARVFRPNSTGLERIGSNEGIEVHGRAEGIHH
jgi:hypothetical protein